MSAIRRVGIVVVVLAVLITCAVVTLHSVAYIPPILMYHSISPQQPSDTLHVSQPTFQRQMGFLRKNKYNVIPLESLAALIREKRKIPPKTVAITFDDGRKDNYTFAFPILRHYRLPATIFVIVNEVTRPDRLTWEEIRAMDQSGVITIGSHTLDHPYLLEINSTDELTRQIFDSKAALESHLGRPVEAFSYPIGGFNAQIRKIVMDAGYRCSVATAPGKHYPNDDIFALKRIKITEKANNLFVFRVQTSGYYTFFKDFFSMKKSKGYGE